jgi:glycerate kinase
MARPPATTTGDAGRPLRVVVATDSFKGSLSSVEAGTAIGDGVLEAAPEAVVDVVAVADGGEGTIDAYAFAGALDEVEVDGVDAVGRPLRAAYGLRRSGGRSTAVIEAARTVGLGGLGPVDEALPAAASSRGLGLHLRHALGAGADDVVVGLGGTACTDGGTGLLLALGAAVTDAAGHPVDTLGNPLLLHDALAVAELPDLRSVEVLTDVRSPLLGPDGASRMFAPQKGASTHQVRTLEHRMSVWADALERRTGRSVRDLPGAGAAGGAGAALAACGARLVPGFDRVAEEVGLLPLLAGADVVITGEGRVDAQTALGKGPYRVAELARARGWAVVVALTGEIVVRTDIDDNARATTAPSPFDAVFPVHRGPLTLSSAIDPSVTREALRASSREVIRLVVALRRPRRPVGDPGQ